TTTVPARARGFAVFDPPPHHNAAITVTAMTFVTAAMVRAVHRVIGPNLRPLVLLAQPAVRPREAHAPRSSLFTKSASSPHGRRFQRHAPGGPTFSGRMRSAAPEGGDEDSADDDEGG